MMCTALCSSLVSTSSGFSRAQAQGAASESSNDPAQDKSLTPNIGGDSAVEGDDNDLESSRNENSDNPVLDAKKPQQQSRPSGEQAPDKIRFSAIVQFATKGAERVDARKNRVPLSFQDTLYEGDRIHVDKGAYAKFILKSGCILVVYGEGQTLAPNREKPWRVNSEAMRAICPADASLPVLYRGLLINPLGTDVLLSGNRLLVLRGTPKVKGIGKFSAPAMFTLAKGAAAALTPAPSANEIYQLNQTWPAPKESLTLRKPEAAPLPKRQATTRVMIGPAFGGGRFRHDHRTYNDSSMSSGGGRLQGHFKSGDRSVIIAVTPFLEIEDSENRDECFNNCPPPGESVAEIEATTIEGGVRFDHQKWLAPYVRGGLALLKNRMNVRSKDGSYYNHRIEYYGLSAAAGIDGYYRPAWLSWFGLYGNAEVFAMRAIVKGADKDQSNCESCFPQPPPPIDPTAPFTVGGLTLGLGLIFQF